MSAHSPTPKLVMGHIEIVANGETSVPNDDAVIHIDGDEDSEIEVHCPDALRLAAFIVKATNVHDNLVKALVKIEYALRKDILTDNERVESARVVALAALASIKEQPCS